MSGGALVRERILFRAAEEGYAVTALCPSSDRRRLAYVLAPAGAEEGALWVFDRATGRRNPLGHLDHAYWSPAWIEGGRALLAASSRSGAGELWRVTLDGGPHRRLTALGGNVACASPAPTDDRVAFLGACAESYDLWLVHLSAGVSRRLTDRGLWIDRAPGPGRRAMAGVAWSPDGSKIAFSSALRADDRTWITGVSTVDPETGRIRRIFERTSRTTDDCALLDLSWSADGRAIAFRRRIGSKDHLLVISPSGRRLLKRKYIASVSECPWDAIGGSVVIAGEPGLIEMHRPHDGTVRTFRQQSGLHRLQGPFFDGPDGLLYARGSAVARLPIPDPEAECAFILDPDPPGAENVEAQHRIQIAQRLARLRESLGSANVAASGPCGSVLAPSSGATAGNESNAEEDLRIAAAHPAFRSQVVARLRSLEEPERGRLLRALVAEEDSTALHAVLTVLSDPAVPCGADLRNALFRRLAADLPTPDPATLAALLRTLAERGHREARSHFEAALEEDDDRIRSAGAYALLLVHPESADSVLARLRPSTRKSWVDLGIPAPAPAPGRRHLWPNLSDSRACGDPVFLEALRALVRGGGRVSPDTLQRLAGHADPTVRAWTLHALERLADPTDGHIARERLRDPSPGVRSAAVGAWHRRSGAAPAGPRIVTNLRAERSRDSVSEARYWGVRIHGTVRAVGGPCERVTFSLDLADRWEIAESGPLPPNVDRAVEFGFSIALWEPVPESLTILVESFDGVRDACCVALVGPA